jgi:hypothetical protein
MRLLYSPAEALHDRRTDVCRAGLYGILLFPYTDYLEAVLQSVKVEI